MLETLFPARCIGCARGDGVVRGMPGRGLPYLPPGCSPRCAAGRGPRSFCGGCRQLSPALSVVRARLRTRGAGPHGRADSRGPGRARYLAPLMVSYSESSSSRGHCRLIWSCQCRWRQNACASAASIRRCCWLKEVAQHVGVLCPALTPEPSPIDPPSKPPGQPSRAQEPQGRYHSVSGLKGPQPPGPR